MLQARTGYSSRSSHHWLTEWAIASKRKRLDTKSQFKYPDLQCYSKDVTEKAEASETYNWFSLPEEEYPDYAHLCSKIMDNYIRPIFTKKDAEGPCIVFQTNKANEID